MFQTGSYLAKVIKSKITSTRFFLYSPVPFYRRSCMRGLHLDKFSIFEIPRDSGFAGFLQNFLAPPPVGVDLHVVSFWNWNDFANKKVFLVKFLAASVCHFRYLMFMLAMLDCCPDYIQLNTMQIQLSLALDLVDMQVPSRLLSLV